MRRSELNNLRCDDGSNQIISDPVLWNFQLQKSEAGGFSRNSGIQGWALKLWLFFEDMRFQRRTSNGDSKCWNTPTITRISNAFWRRNQQVFTPSMSCLWQSLHTSHDPPLEAPNPGHWPSAGWRRNVAPPEEKKTVHMAKFNVFQLEIEKYNSSPSKNVHWSKSEINSNTSQRLEESV